MTVSVLPKKKMGQPDVTITTIVIEGDEEKYDFWLYQAIENSNSILTAWGTDKPYFQNTFQITDEERSFIESLLD